MCGHQQELPPPPLKHPQKTGLGLVSERRSWLGMIMRLLRRRPIIT